MEGSKKIDILDEDCIRVPAQNFALVSFVGPEQRQKNDHFGMKVRGVFDTVEMAHAHVKKLQANGGGDFDIWVMDMYKWVVCPPDFRKIDDQSTDIHYQEPYLEELMQGYRKNKLERTEVFNERTDLVKKEGLDKHLLPDEKLPPPAEFPTKVLESADPHPSTAPVSVPADDADKP